MIKVHLNTEIANEGNLKEKFLMELQEIVFFVVLSVYFKVGSKAWHTKAESQFVYFQEADWLCEFAYIFILTDNE